MASLIAPSTLTDNAALLLDDFIPVGGNTIIASFTKRNEKTSDNQSAYQVDIVNIYSLSKLANLHVAYAKSGTDIALDLPSEIS